MTFSNVVRSTLSLKNGFPELAEPADGAAGDYHFSLTSTRTKARRLTCWIERLAHGRPWGMSSSLDVKREAGIVTMAKGQHQATIW